MRGIAHLVLGQATAAADQSGLAHAVPFRGGGAACSAIPNNASPGAAAL
ncbi:MAG: hypothetical protein QM758_27595 [Armatimonas sp.]